MKNGDIVGQGRHKGSFYAELYNAHFEGKEI